ncbi:biotin--[acetyl-CoA-carboxylase] ligase [Flagellimonas algicola]|uniref:Biotin--[acetyl-CoA-carboxylase] ligase n=1 Tax=Flagellimonas algicola TaxID=2583815 RepID=A0ABY2WG42_9FLAO|nr:biotin--[acetyl-CoA-carboxylase] ligase [Allomuricauda algicola]TMU50517.1 biotin--[acetyl-CoA-carboxylase] ligase [Allomuricauda algicola]
MGEHSQIIKLDATDSTNLYLRSLARAKNLEDYTCVVARAQEKGRGQMGTNWQSQPGKNLTFSVLKKFEALPAEQQFKINIAVSLAIYDALNKLNILNLKVKWPNDIMSGSDKICGILIENVLKGQAIQNSIIGIGLNVNQTEFNKLGKVASLKSILGRSLELEELLQKLLARLKFQLHDIENRTIEELLPQYAKKLFRKDKPSTFKDEKGEVFMGFIRGVSHQGKLVLELEDQIFREFGLKEVFLLS